MSKDQEFADQVVNETSVIVTLLDDPSWDEIESWLADDSQLVNSNPKGDVDTIESILQSHQKE